MKVKTEDISSIAGLVLLEWSWHRISSSDADIKNYFVFLYSVSLCHATIGCVTSDRGHDIRDIGRPILFSKNRKKLIAIYLILLAKFIVGIFLVHFLWTSSLKC